jgi:hypothetical protein
MALSIVPQLGGLEPAQYLRAVARLINHVCQITQMQCVCVHVCNGSHEAVLCCAPKQLIVSEIGTTVRHGMSI